MMDVVTTAQPDEREWGDLLFAWRVCKHVRSNAIVIARDLATVGIGAGQMSRVDAVRIALDKALQPVAGAVLASDAFFPFPDGVEAALEQGVTAFIQPGGSKRDDEVITRGRRGGRDHGADRPAPLQALTPSAARADGRRSHAVRTGRRGVRTAATSGVRSIRGRRRAVSTRERVAAVARHQEPRAGPAHLGAAAAADLPVYVATRLGERCGASR